MATVALTLLAASTLPYALANSTSTGHKGNDGFHLCVGLDSKHSACVNVVWWVIVILVLVVFVLCCCFVACCSKKDDDDSYVQLEGQDRTQPTGAIKTELEEGTEPNDTATPADRAADDTETPPN